jgi:hypothetical protein
MSAFCPWRTFALAGVAVLVAACVEKELLPPAAIPRGAAIRISADFLAQLEPGTRAIDVKVGYDRTSGVRVVMGDAHLALTSSTQETSIPVELRQCLDDPARAGTPDSCPVRVAVTLSDSSGATIDT